MKNIVVLISGNGSNLQAIIDQSIHASNQDGSLILSQCKIALVVSNRESAYGLVRAQQASIPTLYFPLSAYKNAGKSREEYDKDLAEVIKTKVDGEIDLIVLAGWMHILSPAFLDVFPTKVINLHPALPGAFDGANAIKRAYESFKEGKIQGTGIMVHEVIPEVDKGQVILTQEVEIKEQDSLEDLEQRIHVTEHQLIVRGIAKKLGLN